MKAPLVRFVACIFSIIGLSAHAESGPPIGSAFSYRGSLATDGTQANGIYDLKFSLFDSLTNGTSVAASITNASLLVSNGLFSAALDFGAAAFNGEKRWLEIGVRTNGDSADFETLAPRQELAPQPYALFAPNAGSASVALSVSPGSLAGPFSLTNPANFFTGDGSGLTGVAATSLGGLGSTGFWHTGGNSGTAAGLNFLGTADDQPLELKVNGLRGLRLEPATNGSPNLVGGAGVNFVAVDIGGATIGGGGAAWPGEANSVAENFGTIGGGSGNSIEALQEYGTIGGGHSNRLGLAFSGDNTIGGGFSNIIWAGSSVISGGSQNGIGQPFDDWGFGHSIGGGTGNFINYQNDSSTISGGADNFLDASESSISGGSGNSIYWINGEGHSIGGGLDNQIWALWGGVIGGGRGNSIGTLFGNLGGDYSTISGGQSNLSFGGAYSTISGGLSNVASAAYAAVPGGAQASARLFGQMAHASGQFAAAGDAQASSYVCRAGTADAASTELFLDGTSARLVMPLNTTWAFDILVTGRASNGNSAAYQIRGAIKNNGGTATLVGSPVKTILGEDVTSWDATVSANAANQSLAINVTGAAGTSIRWVASVRTTEVSY